jgi:hypothetical protein
VTRELAGRPARMAVYDIVADRDVGVLLAPGVHQQRELAGSGGCRDVQAGRRVPSGHPVDEISGCGKG